MQPAVRAILSASLQSKALIMIPRTIRVSFAATAIAWSLASSPALAVDIRICTTRGAIDVELDELRAPRHTVNFLNYADSGFYAGTVFHRAVAGAMVQGGSYTRSLDRRQGADPVPNESDNGLSNRRGTIAAARSDDPDSATSQFFFNLTDNTHLDASATAAGYTVFGRVTAGLELLDSISEQPKRRLGDLTDVPSPVVEIESVTRRDRTSVFGLSIEPDRASLQEDFARALAGNNANAILGAVDALNQSCIPLDSSQRLAEAEAAIALGRMDRGRYALENFLNIASPRDNSLARARQLYAGLPMPDRVRALDEMIGQCQRPVAPAIPDGRFTNLDALGQVETSVRRYRQLGERYLGCVANSVESGDLSEPELRIVTDHHNDVVVEITGVTARFNLAVRNFRANSPSAPL